MQATQGITSADPAASAAKLKPGLKRSLPPRTAAAIRGGASVADHDHLAAGDPFSPRKRLKRTPPKGTPPVTTGREHGSPDASVAGPRVLNFGAMASTDATDVISQQSHQQGQDPSTSPPSSPTTSSSPTRTAPRRAPATASRPEPSSSTRRHPGHAIARQPLLHRTPAGKPTANPTPAPATSTPSRSLATPARALPATPLAVKRSTATHAPRAAGFTPSASMPGVAFADLAGPTSGTRAPAGGQSTLSFTPRRHAAPPRSRRAVALAPRRTTYMPSGQTRSTAQSETAVGASAVHAKVGEIGIHRQLRLESMPGGQSQFVDCGPVTRKMPFAHLGEKRDEWDCVPDYVLDFGRSVVFGEFEGCT